MVLGFVSDSRMIHDQEIGGDIDVVDGSAVVLDFTPLAMSYSDLANDQSQSIASHLQDELVGSFIWYYISGYVHQLAYESCMEEMADRFGLSDCYLLYDAYQPSAVHGSYGDTSMVGNLQLLTMVGVQCVDSLHLGQYPFRVFIMVVEMDWALYVGQWEVLMTFAM